MGKTEKYVYLKMEDAVKAINQKVNLMGVIVEYGLPEKSRGTDWFCTLKIMDETYQEHGLVVSVFGERMDKLPHVKSAGDIIHLSQVVMKSHHGKVNIFFNKKTSAFALFEGKSSKNFGPYQASLSYSLVHPDRNFLTSLRNWLLNFELHSGTSDSLLPLKEIGDGKKCIDLVCKILKVYEVSEHSWMLFLWDGTDAPPLSCKTKLNADMENPVPLQLESSVLPRDVLCEFPSVGTVLRVFVDRAGENLALKLPCRWVKIIDLVCEERSGLWCSVLSSSTRVRILSDEDKTVLVRQRDYEERLTGKWKRMPLSSFPWPSHITDDFALQIPETNHEHVPFATLMDVLAHPQVIVKFKCVVRVVAISPCRAENFRSPFGNRLYRIRLTLEDPTARIQAFIYGEDGEKFFDGYPPVDVLTHKLNKLLGIDDGMEDLDAPRNPPWVQLCMFSYYINEDDPWASRKYRIFDTRLLS